MPLVNKNLQNPNCVEMVSLTIQLIARLIQPFFYGTEDKERLQHIQDWLIGFAEVNSKFNF